MQGCREVVVEAKPTRQREDTDSTGDPVVVYFWVANDFIPLSVRNSVI
jgi:hypothetical protein